MDDYEEVLDEFKGIKIWWSSRKTVPEQTTLILDPRDKNVKWYNKLTCHKKHQDFIHKVYLNHVFEKGDAISQKKRERKLYTNSHRDNSYYGGQTTWSHILFEHPSTFDTLALDPKKKKDIINDIERFSKSKDYYNKIGKAWKRGYLLYGPPGTGKSSMIAAMANFLDYDIYYIELTSVKSNVKLRELLIDTSSKAIIVIEDMISTLDPALIRSGRMDMHIELSYCCFEAFKVLAKNYLDVESHELFVTIGQLLEETNMTPADVAENLMPKSDEDNANTCLNNLIKCLENAKEGASKKSYENVEKVQDDEESRKIRNQSSDSDG
ncbi:AAA-ATPase ASD, mitochondrial-like protein isoform X2 [Tanacetum coccineum]